MSQSVEIGCPWCGGSGRVPCDTPWCDDMSHDGDCFPCKGSGGVQGTWRGERWLVRCPVQIVPFRVTLDNPTTSPHQETP